MIEAVGVAIGALGSIDETQALWAAVGLFIAGLVKGTTGLGYSTCALPFLVAGFGMRPAMALVIIPALTTNINLALLTGHLAETLRRFGLLYLAMVPGIAVGVAALVYVSQTSAARTLAVVIVAYVGFAVLKPDLTLPSRLERWLQIPTGFCNGVLAGVTGSQVIPLFPFVMALKLDQNRMVQAINLAVLIASVVQAVGMAAADVLDSQLMMASVAGIVPALLGVAAGAKARHLIPAERLRTLVLLVLLLMAGSMLVQ